jgi:hypothetical protein
MGDKQQTESRSRLQDGEANSGGAIWIARALVEHADGRLQVQFIGAHLSSTGANQRATEFCEDARASGTRADPIAPQKFHVFR